MKYKGKYAIGQRVKLIFANDALEILKVISDKNWIYKIPNSLIDLIDDNFDIALESIKYVPNIYFDLNERFKSDKQLIKATIKSFRKHDRINEINIKTRPLTKKV